MAFPCPYPPKVLLKEAELRELGHLLTTNLTYDHPHVARDMGDAGPARGRVRWQTRHARRAQCATALALAILAVLVAMGTLVADGESAPTDARACSGARAGEPATICNTCGTWEGFVGVGGSKRRPAVAIGLLRAGTWHAPTCT